MTGKKFSGRVVLVTGAASGIGAACAQAFADEGARIVLVDVDETQLLERQQQLTDLVGQDSVLGYAIDITDRAKVREAVDDVVASFGGIDHLVNSAASFVAAGRAATAEDWNRSLGVNVVGSAMLSALVSEHMTSGGTIVNISSISAHIAQAERWTYNATKAAILALTKCQALDFGPQGIRVNAVSPGWIWTPEVARAAEGGRAEWEPKWGEFHILRRLGEANEVADAVLYLSGTSSSFVTGTELMVDGGYSALGPEGLGVLSRFAGSR
jgi:NAD(P)-dependent dehydrogenase (short-subunit alcohol dehydrogenase family)